MAKKALSRRDKKKGNKPAGGANLKRHKTMEGSNLNRKSKSKNKNGRYYPVGGGDLHNPDMIDDYYFGHEYDKNSMRMGGFRPGKPGQETDVMQQQPLRKRPVEFIKAKDVYDPSHDLIMKLREQYDRQKLGAKAQETEEPVRKEQKTSIRDIPDEALFFEDGEPSAEVSSIKTVLVDEEGPKKREDDITEFQDYLTVGKAQLNLQEDQNGGVYVKKHYMEEEDDGEEDSVELDSLSEEAILLDESDDQVSLSSTIGNLSIGGTESNTEDAENLEVRIAPESEAEVPEFGFVEEDYINISEVAVTNVRLGGNANSYYLSSYRFLGDNEPRWVDEQDLVDYVFELGLPEERVGPYLKYVVDSLTPGSEQDSLQLRIDREAEAMQESSSEESDADSISDIFIGNDEKENIQDLIAYTMKYEKTRNQQFDTKSISTSGKGAKKRLLVDEALDLDEDLKLELQDKFLTRNDHHRKKRQAKENYISDQNRKSTDLFVKYPYGFHVQNIKDEFEAFLTRNHTQLAFPPFDPNGNKVVAKFAEAYCTKPKKAGKNGKTFVVAEKVKRTKWSTPDYNYINQLLNRRRVFMRIDVRRPVAERPTSEKSSSGKGKFHVKEGTIVGADAPEISRDNIGRRMLESLGWSTGQGLGVDGNQGISEPIFATVKKSKSGLRHSNLEV
ncbi:LAMI_0F14796g1_1 [Lachancea mirantina]|uniref:LAMI_0F14796g1_1 n=1 Tax=Lachancea mirantina TaxID=1230905 RepID=A0A1G4K454_9SACH|nr:LAMI_0F14796g1_1 [Lachancea mirantina]